MFVLPLPAWVSGLSSESETGLGPVETDTDSHRPLMSDEEDEVEVEVEVHARRYQSVQQPDEPLAEPPQAIGFLQAFCLPGVLPVSLEQAFLHMIQAHYTIFTPCVCLNCSTPWPTHV